MSEKQAPVEAEVVETPTEVAETPTKTTTEETPKSLLSTSKEETTEETTETTTEETTEEVESVPETVDGYDFGERDLPEEILNSEQMLSMDGFKEFCLENKVSTDLAKKLLAFHDTSASETFAKLSESSKTFEAESEAEFSTRIEGLKEDLGGQDGFDKAVNNVNTLLISKGFSDEELAKDGFNNSIIGIKLVNELLGRLGEDSVATDGTTVGNSSLDSQLEQLKSGGIDGAYYNSRHPDHIATVKKFGELMDRKTKLS